MLSRPQFSLLAFAVFLPTIVHAAPPTTQASDWPTTQAINDGMRATSDSLFAATPGGTDAQKSAQAINAIIYSPSPKEKMIAELKPYVAIADDVNDFKKKSGLRPTLVSWSGWGVAACSFSDCGLVVVLDPDGKVRRLQRSQQKVGDVVYPAMCITAERFDWHGASNTYEAAAPQPTTKTTE